MDRESSQSEVALPGPRQRSAGGQQSDHRAFNNQADGESDPKSSDHPFGFAYSGHDGVDQRAFGAHQQPACGQREPVNEYSFCGQLFWRGVEGFGG